MTTLCSLAAAGACSRSVGCWEAIASQWSNILINLHDQPHKPLAKQGWASKLLGV